MLEVAAREVDLNPTEFSDIDLELRPLRALEEGAEMVMFVHLVDDERRLVRTFDHPVEWDDWRVGEDLRLSVRLHLSALSEPPPAGSYTLTAGLYDPLIGRFPIRTDRRSAGKREYEIARVRIGESARSATELELGDGWKAGARGGGREIVVRRPNRPEGVASVVLHRLSGPTEVWFQIANPEVGLADRLRIGDGTDRARVRISSPCAPLPVEAVGPGHHSVSLTLTPVASAQCEIRFETNHAVRIGGSREISTTALYGASWSRR